MNSGDEIKRVQELDENKKLLAAQREMYSTAKKHDFLNVVVCFAIPYCATLTQMFFSIPPCALVAIWLFTVIAGLALPHLSAELAKKAARVQQSFDSRVFGVSFENADFKKGDISKYADDYFARCERKGEGPRLDDWYSADLSGLKAGEAIARCQKQNTEWTKRLLLRSLGGEVLAAVVLAGILWLLITGSSVDPLSLAFLTTIVEWLFQRIVRCFSTLQKVEKLTSASELFNLGSRENIERAQDRIYDYRSSSYLVSDFMYRLFKESDDAATSRD